MLGAGKAAWPPPAAASVLLCTQPRRGARAQHPWGRGWQVLPCRASGARLDGFPHVRLLGGWAWRTLAGPFPATAGLLGLGASLDDRFRAVLQLRDLSVGWEVRPCPLSPCVMCSPLWPQFPETSQTAIAAPTPVAVGLKSSLSDTTALCPCGGCGRLAPSSPAPHSAVPSSPHRTKPTCPQNACILQRRWALVRAPGLHHRPTESPWPLPLGEVVRAPPLAAVASKGLAPSRRADGGGLPCSRTT